MTKLKEITQILTKLKTQIVTKPKNSNYKEKKIKISNCKKKPFKMRAKLENSNCDNTQKLKW